VSRTDVMSQEVLVRCRAGCAWLQGTSKRLSDSSLSDKQVVGGC
jgi:hypothetical protein